MCHSKSDCIIPQSARLVSLGPGLSDTLYTVPTQRPGFYFRPVGQILGGRLTSIDFNIAVLRVVKVKASALFAGLGLTLLRLCFSFLQVESMQTACPD